MITRITDIGREVVVEAADVRGRGFCADGKNLVLQTSLRNEITHLILEEEVVDAISQTRMPEITIARIGNFLEGASDDQWLQVNKFFDDKEPAALNAAEHDPSGQGVIETGDELLVRIHATSFGEIMEARALYECIRRHGLAAVVAHLSSLT